MKIRQAEDADFTKILAVIKDAFANEEMSDKTEHLLVERLRDSSSYIPELSIVAVCDDKIVGHILLTKIQIINADYSFESLALAPVSVLPKFQGRAIGSSLINEAHQTAKLLGYKSVILLGHKDYYPRFGYKPCSDFGIELPFDVPAEYCMAIELIENGLKGVAGTVVYDPAFMISN